MGTGGTRAKVREDAGLILFRFRLAIDSKVGAVYCCKVPKRETRIWLNPVIVKLQS